MPSYLAMPDKISIFISVKQQVNDITEVLRSLSAQIESMQKTIDSQYATICQINRTSQAQLRKIRTLEQTLKKKDKEIDALMRRLSKYEEPPKNSGNSNTPPSKESVKDEIVRRTKSLRKPSGKKPGGQAGHVGNTLELNAAPDKIVEASAERCGGCGASLSGCDTELDHVTQIISLPELKPLVTEMRHYVTICRACVIKSAWHIFSGNANISMNSTKDSNGQSRSKASCRKPYMNVTSDRRNTLTRSHGLGGLTSSSMRTRRN